MLQKKVRNARMRGWVKLGFGMFDHINSGGGVAARQHANDDRQGLNEALPGLLDCHGS
ncbi:MAG: hypothetical protein MJD61_08850 [Proteobacteria bacterium]|nr:hypothetical protein [Pseudomonadota bacterium]